MLSSIFLLCCLLVAVLFDGMPHRAPLRHNADDGYLFVAAKVDGSAADEGRIIVPTLAKRTASGAAKMPKSLRKQVRGPVTEREIAYARLTDLIGVDPEDLPSSLAAKLFDFSGNTKLRKKDVAVAASITLGAGATAYAAYAASKALRQKASASIPQTEAPRVSAGSETPIATFAGFNGNVPGRDDFKAPPKRQSSMPLTGFIRGRETKLSEKKSSISLTMHDKPTSRLPREGSSSPVAERLLTNRDRSSSQLQFQGPGSSSRDRLNGPFSAVDPLSSAAPFEPMSRESSNGQNSAFTFESRVPIVTANGAPVPAHDALDQEETPMPALIDAKIHTPPTDEPPAAPESSLSHTETANLDSLKNDRDAISTQTDPMVWPYQEPPQPPKEENAAADEDHDNAQPYQEPPQPPKEENAAFDENHDNAQPATKLSRASTASTVKRHRPDNEIPEGEQTIGTGSEPKRNRFHRLLFTKERASSPAPEPSKIAEQGSTAHLEVAKDPKSAKKRGLVVSGKNSIMNRVLRRRSSGPSQDDALDGDANDEAVGRLSEETAREVPGRPSISSVSRSLLQRSKKPTRNDQVRPGQTLSAVPAPVDTVPSPRREDAPLPPIPVAEEPQTSQTGSAPPPAVDLPSLETPSVDSLSNQSPPSIRPRTIDLPNDESAPAQLATVETANTETRAADILDVHRAEGDVRDMAVTNEATWNPVLPVSEAQAQQGYPQDDLSRGDITDPALAAPVVDPMPDELSQPSDGMKGMRDDMIDVDDDVNPNLHFSRRASPSNAPIQFTHREDDLPVAADIVGYDALDSVPGDEEAFTTNAATTATLVANPRDTVETYHNKPFQPRKSQGWPDYAQRSAAQRTVQAGLSALSSSGGETSHHQRGRTTSRKSDEKPWYKKWRSPSRSAPSEQASPNMDAGSYTGRPPPMPIPNNGIQRRTLWRSPSSQTGDEEDLEQELTPIPREGADDDYPHVLASDFESSPPREAQPAILARSPKKPGLISAVRNAMNPRRLQPQQQPSEHIVPQAQHDHIIQSRGGQVATPERDDGNLPRVHKGGFNTSTHNRPGNARKSSASPPVPDARPPHLNSEGLNTLGLNPYGPGDDDASRVFATYAGAIPQEQR